jgi:sec-independent protein translocase protein TatB
VRAVASSLRTDPSEGLLVPGVQELLVIAVVALFVLGPERLPEVMRAGGRLLTKVRNYGVTATKELRGVADFGGIEQEVMELRRELDRTRADLRRAMRETLSSGDAPALRPHTPVEEPSGTQDGTPDTRG